MMHGAYNVKMKLVFVQPFSNLSLLQNDVSQFAKDLSGVED